MNPIRTGMATKQGNISPAYCSMCMHAEVPQCFHLGYVLPCQDKQMHDCSAILLGDSEDYNSLSPVKIRAKPPNDRPLS